jgi:hypothetical protein
MPIWEDEGALQATKTQSGILERVRAGNALPIISNAAMLNLVLFGHDAFTHYYAERVNYPFAMPAGVSQISNFDRHSNRGSELECRYIFWTA